MWRSAALRSSQLSGSVEPFEQLREEVAPGWEMLLKILILNQFSDLYLSTLTPLIIINVPTANPSPGPEKTLSRFPEMSYRTLCLQPPTQSSTTTLYNCMCARTPETSKCQGNLQASPKITLKLFSTNSKCSFFWHDIAHRSLDAISVGQELFCISSLKIHSNFTFFCLAVGVFQMCNARRFHMWSREGITLCHFDGNHLDSLRTKNTKNSQASLKTEYPAMCCKTFVLILIK